ncbi:hypothetical protein H8S95_01595 [Pontibacter sp. KCTC 32443]|nr:hypothetical protein [Pontibacter sp. KCTC 32443]
MNLSLRGQGNSQQVRFRTRMSGTAIEAFFLDSVLSYSAFLNLDINAIRL